MRLSINDDDGNLGDLLDWLGHSAISGGATGVGVGGTREVTIYVTGNVGFANAAASASLVASRIRAVLSANGWSIRNVTPALAGFGMTSQSYVIIANVFRNFSDSQILSNVRRDLASVMTVTRASIVLSAASGSAGGSIGVPAGGVDYQNVPASAGNTGGSGVGNAISGALNNFALGSGITTPLVIGGGLLVLLLILRK